MNRQRLSLTITAILLVATSVGSSLYYGVATGLAFPFIAPIMLLPSSIGSHPRWWLVAVLIAGIVFVGGVIAWYRCRPLLTYPFVVTVILLVMASEYLVYLLGRVIG